MCLTVIIPILFFYSLKIYGGFPFFSHHNTFFYKFINILLSKQNLTLRRGHITQQLIVQ